MSGALGRGHAPSMAAVQHEIVAEMAGLTDPLQKYAYLVQLGRALEPPAESIREDAHEVAGCQSQVWIRADLEDGRMHILADGEAMITRGIIALLLRVLDGRTPAEILEGELFFIERTGLAKHLSPARGNGLAAMVQKIRNRAEEASALNRPGPQPAQSRGPSPVR